MTGPRAPGGEIYLVYAASSFITGWTTHRLIAAGVSLTWSRKPFLVAARLIVAAAGAMALLAALSVFVLIWRVRETAWTRRGTT